MMKVYFIAIEGKVLGPMDVAGVRALRPTRETLVWFEGLEQWTGIGYVAELADCVDKGDVPPLPEDVMMEGKGAEGPRAKRRDWVRICIIGAVTVVAVTAIVTAGSLIADGRLRKQLEVQSQRAEQLKLEQAEAEYRHQLEAERQKAEREREAAEAERRLRQHVEELRNERLMLNGRIAECGRRLEKAQEFHFLRTSGEKAYEIKQIVDERNGYMDRVAAIDAELASYGAR